MYDNFYTLLEAEGILPVWLTTGTVFVMCNFKNNFILFYFCFVKALFYSSCYYSFYTSCSCSIVHSHFIPSQVTHYLHTQKYGRYLPHLGTPLASSTRSRH